MLYMLIPMSILLASTAAFLIGRAIGHIEGRTEAHLKMVETLTARTRGPGDDAR
jgi:hypothetical protein